MITTDLLGGRIVPAHNTSMGKFLWPPFSVIRTDDSKWQARRRAWASLGLEEGRYDPVLCELVYEWFSPKRSFIVDPINSDEVAEVVAQESGRNYTSWSRVREDEKIDLVFSIVEWVETFENSIKKAAGALENNRFICLVVRDSLDESGFYVDFPGFVIDCLTKLGCVFYGETIIVDPCKTISSRDFKRFVSSRRVQVNHQTLLIFVKGDDKEAVKYCGNII